MRTAALGPLLFTVMTLVRIAVVATLPAFWACGSPFRPSCEGKSGPVTSVSGSVGAGQTVVHRLPYGTEGSQNDLVLTWTGHRDPGGPQLQFYATRISCEDFSPASASGPCEILRRAGSFEGHVATTLILTHGQGNPEQLGTPAEYKLWVVGDPQQSANYSVTVTWRRPVEC